MSNDRPVTGARVATDVHGESMSDDMFAPECSIEKALAIIGGKWSFLILRELYHGPQRFNELRRQLGSVSPKSLTDALRHLEEHGVVSRRAFATVPVTVEYSVTEKGAAFHGVLKEMKMWGALWG